MDIALKYRIVEKIIQINDETLLNEIYSLLELSERGYWDDLPGEVKQAIEKAKLELDRGEGLPHQVVISEIKNRFLKS